MCECQLIYRCVVIWLHFSLAFMQTSHQRATCQLARCQVLSFIQEHLEAPESLTLIVWGKVQQRRRSRKACTRGMRWTNGYKICLKKKQMKNEEENWWEEWRRCWWSPCVGSSATEVCLYLHDWTMQDSVWTPRGPCVGSVDVGQMSLPLVLSLIRSFFLSFSLSSNPRYKNTRIPAAPWSWHVTLCVCVFWEKPLSKNDS